MASFGNVVESAVSCATTTACVSGANTKAVPGVAATSKTGTAMTASGVTGFTATGTTGTGVSGTSTKYYGVTGTAGSSGRGGVLDSAASVDNAGVSGTNLTSGYGVYGISNGGHGVWGTSSGASGVGVEGLETGAGVGVLGHTQSGLALYGVANSGNAVEAISKTGTGVFASTGGSATAMYAQSNTGYGLEAISNGQPSVYGQNSNGDGAEFQGSYIGVIGIAPASGGLPFVAFDQNSNAVFQVTGTGDVDYTGSINHLAKVSGGALVKSYAPLSSAPTVEDIGSAQLVSGAAAVRLNPTFAASIDETTAYHVFLTPDGDTRGLYVATRTPTGFIVRETQGGRATLAFEYRIVAAARGQANQRMAVVSPSEFARAPLTAATKARSLAMPLREKPPQP